MVEERGEDWHRAQAQFRVVDEDGSGRLDKEEVAGLLDMLGMGRLAGVELDAAMLAMDADGSGDLDPTEIRQGLGTLGVECSRGAARAMFAALDADGDGSVSYVL